MILYAYPALAQFPKAEKYALVVEIKTCMHNMLKIAIICNKRYYKNTTLRELDVELDMLRFYVRLAFNLHFLPPKKYEVWAKLNDEIGRMLGGWIKVRDF